MSLPSEVRAATAGPPSPNGDIARRVQQLRLGDRLAAAPRSGGGGSWLPWVLCGLLATAWVGVGVRWYRAAGDRPAGPAAPAAVPPGGAAAPAAGAAAAKPVPAGEIALQLKGNLIPSLQIAVSPIDVAGEVTEIHFKEGDRVRTGQLLARLRDNRYRNEFKTAEANVIGAEGRLKMLLPESVRAEEKQQAEAELEDARATLMRAEQDLRRLEGQRVAGAFAQQELDKAVADVRSGKARVVKSEKALALLLQGPRPEQIAAAQGDLDAAKFRRDEAKRMVDNCEIKAPIDGTVLTKKSDVGSLVSPMSFNVAAALCEIADLSKLEVELDVPEREITKIRPGLDCRLAADADPTREYKGRVDRVMPIADDSKNVIKVRVAVDLPPGEPPGSFLKPKMSVVVTVYNRDADGKKN